MGFSYNSANKLFTVTFNAVLKNPIVCDRCANNYGFNPVNSKCEPCTFTDANCL